jgi:hypothetical protein
MEFEILLDSCRNRKKHSGGSLASTAVNAHVSQAAYENMHYMLSGGNGLPAAQYDSSAAIPTSMIASLAQPLPISASVGNQMTFPSNMTSFSPRLSS